MNRLNVIGGNKILVGGGGADEAIGRITTHLLVPRMPVLPLAKTEPQMSYQRLEIAWCLRFLKGGVEPPIHEDEMDAAGVHFHGRENILQDKESGEEMGGECVGERSSSTPRGEINFRAAFNDYTFRGNILASYMGIFDEEMDNIDNKIRKERGEYNSTHNNVAEDLI